MSRIRPYLKNPRFWEFEGAPILLIGGSVEDNLFQITNLEEHLDHLVDAGGNYVRCTMSSRDEGNVWPYAEENTTLEAWAFYAVRGHERNPFFVTVPECNNDTVVLPYQRAFVAEILEHTSDFGHVLYCVTNEIHEGDPPESGWYWARFVRELDSDAQVTETYQPPDFENPLHNDSFDHPEIYTFFESSQNSARSGKTNWAQFLMIRERTAAAPRPLGRLNRRALISHETATQGADTHGRAPCGMLLVNDSVLRPRKARVTLLR